MPRPAQFRPLPLPRGWPRRVRSAVVQVISLARTSLALTRGRLISPSLRPLRCLHDRWNSSPDGTTFTGGGLSPAGSTSLSSRHNWTTTPDRGIRRVWLRAAAVLPQESLDQKVQAPGFGFGVGPLELDLNPARPRKSRISGKRLDHQGATARLGGIRKGPGGQRK
jgi:hypothetical protein